MIIQEITENQFIKEFDEYNRSNNFSINGRIALFNYLNEIYTDETPFNLDIIALCCEFVEYDNIEEYLKDYNTDLDKKDYEFYEDKEIEEEEFLKDLEEEINNKTSLIKIGDDLNEGFIIQAF